MITNRKFCLDLKIFIKKLAEEVVRVFTATVESISSYTPEIKSKEDLVNRRQFGFT
jgi:hypothetical protein